MEVRGRCLLFLGCETDLTQDSLIAAENPCELNCMPKGENFFYRHRQAVVDGTPCHPGRKDVCVGGVCKV